MSEQPASKVPQIRFKGFEGEWQAKALGKVLKIENGFAFKSRYFCDHNTGVVVLTPGSVKIGGGFQDGKGHFYESDDSVPAKYKFESGDLFITLTDLTPTAQALGYPAKVPEDGVTYLHNQRLGRLVDFNGDSEFLFQLLSTDKYHRIIVSTSSGTTVKHSFPQKVLGIENNFPTITEQTRIGEYFRELDSLIGLHQHKHDKLVTLKKAMLQKMFPQPGATTPEIRFKGFSGEWAQKKLGEATANVANNTLSRANLNYRSGLARNVHYGDILVRFGEVLDVQSDGVPFVSDDAVVNKLMSSNLENGDIVMADAAEDEMVGKCTEIQNVSDQIVLAGLHTIPLRPLLHFAPFYLGYYLNSNGYHDQLLPIMQGTKVLSISKTAIKQTAICFPVDEAEQQKIGTYFRTLDTLISQHATQLQKLQQIKSACLEKMFV